MLNEKQKSDKRHDVRNFLNGSVESIQTIVDNYEEKEMCIELLEEIKKRFKTASTQFDELVKAYQKLI